MMFFKKFISTSFEKQENCRIFNIRASKSRESTTGSKKKNTPKTRLHVEEQRLTIEPKRHQISTENNNIQLCLLGIISEANVSIAGKLN